jgi:hypothetical protein
MSNVRSLNGGPVAGQRETSEAAIAAEENLLEQVRAGEVIGFVIAKAHFDHLGSYEIAGYVGAYSTLGALEMAKAALINGNS